MSPSNVLQNSVLLNQSRQRYPAKISTKSPKNGYCDGSVTFEDFLQGIAALLRSGLDDECHIVNVIDNTLL